MATGQLLVGGPKIFERGLAKIVDTIFLMHNFFPNKNCALKFVGVGVPRFRSGGPGGGHPLPPLCVHIWPHRIDPCLNRLLLKVALKELINIMIKIVSEIRVDGGANVLWANQYKFVHNMHFLINSINYE
jgi:hypothetical protein